MAISHHYTGSLGGGQPTIEQPFSVSDVELLTPTHQANEFRTPEVVTREHDWQGLLASDLVDPKTYAVNAFVLEYVMARLGSPELVALTTVTDGVRIQAICGSRVSRILLRQDVSNPPEQLSPIQGDHFAATTGSDAAVVTRHLANAALLDLDHLANTMRRHTLIDWDGTLDGETVRRAGFVHTRPTHAAIPTTREPAIVNVGDTNAD